MAPGLTLNQPRVRFVDTRTRLPSVRSDDGGSLPGSLGRRQLDRYHSLSSAGTLAYELTDWVNSTPLRDCVMPICVMRIGIMQKRAIGGPGWNRTNDQPIMSRPL